jgi:hypothetical protein
VRLSFLCETVLDNARLYGKGYAKFTGCKYYPTETITFHGDCNIKGEKCKQKVKLALNCNAFNNRTFIIANVSDAGYSANFQSFDNNACKGKPAFSEDHPVNQCNTDAQGLQKVYTC